MKKSQFLGWFKKAYPRINCIKSPDYNNIIYIGNSGTKIIINEDNSIAFSNPALPLVNSDEEIIMMCRHLYGDPEVIFQYSENKSHLKNKEQEIESTPEPKEEKKSIEVKVEKKKETIYNKDIIINTLKERFGDRLKLIPKYFKIEVYVDEVSGPILGDQGLSPNNKMRYKFILYSEKTEIKQILENFFNLFN